MLRPVTSGAETVASASGGSARTGLTQAEVTDRVARGLVNAVEERTSRTLGEIARANVLTRFNLLLGALAVVTLSTRRYQDAAFSGVLVANSLIGIGQEVRAKRTLDRLAVLNAPTADVVREGVVRAVAVGDVVLDDVVEIRNGDQVPADGEVLEAAGLEVDESMLTGESDPVEKEPGTAVLSGSIVVAGHGRFVTTAVGAEAYAQKLAREARRFTRVPSELQAGIDRLLRYTTWAIVGVSPLLLWSQFKTTDTWQDAVTGSVAALVGMIPEGLVLLTSLAFLLAALSLARRHVLVQELPAVEGLARVDVVCLDKTGTLTEGDLAFEAVHPVDGIDRATAEELLAALAHDPEGNATANAVAAVLPAPDGFERTGGVPFSSARKWSATTFAAQGTVVLGAPEILLDDGALKDDAAAMAASGRRVLVLGRTAAAPSADRRPDDLEALALVALNERVRGDASATLAFFAEQGIAVKVISGDSPITVGAVARAVGLEVGDVVDARNLGDDPEVVAQALRDHNVFGRVTPQQKRAFVKALQADGHIVAMTGDGVNDALALKDADIGVAMGSGAPATRAVAQLVLLDSRFAELPRVFAEGRRVIGNVERVANLFVAKNVLAFVLVITSAAAGLPYPFLPRHLTLISTVTIGVPAFCLALGPNGQRHRPGFLLRVVRFAVPSGVVSATAVFLAYLLARSQGGLPDERRTAATVAALVVSLWVLGVLARPWLAWKVVLLASMAGLVALTLAVPGARSYFALTIPAASLLESIAVGAAGAVVVEVAARWSGALRPVPLH